MMRTVGPKKCQILIIQSCMIWLGIRLLKICHLKRNDDVKMYVISYYKMLDDWFKSYGPMK